MCSLELGPQIKPLQRESGNIHVMSWDHPELGGLCVQSVSGTFHLPTWCLCLNMRSCNSRPKEEDVSTHVGTESVPREALRHCLGGLLGRHEDSTREGVLGLHP